MKPAATADPVTAVRPATAASQSAADNRPGTASEKPEDAQDKNSEDKTSTENSGELTVSVDLADAVSFINMSKKLNKIFSISTLLMKNQKQVFNIMCLLLRCCHT